MAVQYEVIEHEGKQARRYPDGSIRNERGHMLVPLPGKHTITSEDAATLAQRKQERKREAIMRGANAVVADGGKFDGTDLDFVEAIAEAQAIKALNPDDPKSTDAARFLLTEAGLSEARQAQQAQPIDAMTDLVRELARFVSTSFDIMSISSTDTATRTTGNDSDREGKAVDGTVVVDG